MAQGTFSVNVEVVNSAGNIWVNDQFAGTDSHGLPSIEIHEKFHPSDGDTRFWGDVELEVKVRLHDGYGGTNGDNPITSIFDGINNVLDNAFNIFNWGNQDSGWGDGCYSQCVPDGETPDQWHDDVVIGIDKFVKNYTGEPWKSFLIEFGTGTGEDFTALNSSSGPYFVSDPMPKEVTSFYDTYPQQNGPPADYLLWTTDGDGHPGQANGDKAVFWFGVNVPYELFEQDPWDDHKWKARFTLRQHSSNSINPNVPEPATGMLLLAGLMASLLSRKEQSP